MTQDGEISLFGGTYHLLHDDEHSSCLIVSGSDANFLFTSFSFISIVADHNRHLKLIYKLNTNKSGNLCSVDYFFVQTIHLGNESYTVGKPANFPLNAAA